MRPPSDLLPDDSRPRESGRLAPLALVVASDADVRAYVSESLAHGLLPIDVETAGSVASALDAAGRRTPSVLVVADAERAILRHLPAVPCVLLADDVPSLDSWSARRRAALVVLRGAFGGARLRQIVGWVLAGRGGVPGH